MPRACGGCEAGRVGAIGNDDRRFRRRGVFARWRRRWPGNSSLGRKAEFRGASFIDNASDRGRAITSPIWYHCSFILSRVFAGLFYILAAETTKIMPMPRLKVRRQSASGISPMLRSSSKTGSTGQEPTLIVTPRPFGRMRGVLSVMPPPVMWTAPFRIFLSCRARRGCQIAAMQLQQFLGDGGAQFRRRAC